MKLAFEQRNKIEESKRPEFIEVEEEEGSDVDKAPEDSRNILALGGTSAVSELDRMSRSDKSLTELPSRFENSRLDQSRLD